MNGPSVAALALLKDLQQRGTDDLQRRFRRSAASIQPVLQIDLELAGTDPKVATEEAQRQTLAWMQNRVGILPREAWRGDSFEHMPGGRAAFVARLQEAEIDCWLARVDDPDRSVPGRTWITEIAVVRYGQVGRFGVRQQVATFEQSRDFCPAVPGIVRQVEENPGLQWRGRPITAQPCLVARDEQARDIIDFIRDPARRLPVIIASLDAGESDVSTSAINANEVAYRSVGLAHVVIITDAMTYRLTDWWGKEYSVFQRAVRVYQPGFNPYEQTPFAHPLYLPTRIEQWPVSRGGPFEDELIRLLAAQSVQRRGTERDFPSYQQVKQAVLRQRREAAQVYDQRESEIVRLLEQELDAKSRETEELMALGADAEDARDQMKIALDEATRERRWLRHRVDQLEAQLKALNQDVTSGIPIPGTYDGLADWAAEHLAGRLVLLPRAARAAKDADFSEPQLAYRALLLLANDYREMRLRGGRDATARFNAKLRELGLQCTRSGERASILEHAEEFVVRYNGRKELLDWHLKNGNTRDPTRCFRCYFLWDAEESMVVVGSLPGHLTTALT